MRKKIIDSKSLHIPFTNKTNELYCDVNVAGPLDFQYENGVTITGIWDTGSEGCLISAELAEKLKLSPVGMKKVIGVHDEKWSPEYLFNLKLPNGHSFEMINVLVGDMVGFEEILIGMSIITQGDFAVTNVNNSTAMSFRTPSVLRINYVTDQEKAKEEEARCKQRQRKDTKRSQKNRKRRR